MALRDAVLAALLDGEASGYDLAKGFDASVANFWMATPQQLYRELDRMASEGLIAARLVEQDRRPNKRLYSLTEQGRHALLEFTEVPPKPGAIREDLLVQVQAVDSGNIEAVRDALTERRQWATAKLARYRRMQEHLLAGRTEAAYLAESERIGPYLTLLRGIRFEEENIDWAARALAVIEQRPGAAARRLR
ncbi:PadR family transcriptional regulator [Mycolicibacterium nivoides]|uniref:PadR family transcriptional regulator n=1 Tax=Mycolicibacterium nivoides TaxID=2487344 RepID=A0ABW9L9Q5_9MYCO|nr:PadR family transcriptional regulator [Mycolicibacterium septicum]SER00581.1 DNA-binding transcriptional regulator, PadR family [Mycobacterium sp. 88mf]SFF92360.1 DNA-binding transcriptional regulator, PadR family [Mycobacterium sp. 455mf]